MLTVNWISEDTPEFTDLQFLEQEVLLLAKCHYSGVRMPVSRENWHFILLLEDEV
jgi:hypothetical protein